MSRSACLLVVVVLAFAAGGCGGGGNARLTKRQYEAKLQSLSHDVAAGIAGFASFRSTDLAAAPGFLNSVAGTLGRLAGALDKVRPPSNVQALHDRLVRGASAAAAELRSLAQKLARATPAQARALLAQFDPSSLAGLQQLEQAARALAAEGYRFG